MGIPPNCRPECISNNECPTNLACINQKCRDPCPGSCGLNAECHVVLHVPNCVCVKDYIGDPFTACTVAPCKLFGVTKLTYYIFSNLISVGVYW